MTVFNPIGFFVRKSRNKKKILPSRMSDIIKWGATWKKKDNQREENKLFIYCFYFN